MEAGNKRNNIYLVGFMGVGKTTVGKMLAEELGMEFLDSDKVIEGKVSFSLKEIFERYGEQFFRERERDFLYKWHPREGVLVACGGGMVVLPGVLEEVLSMGMVVCLTASVREICSRLMGDEDRPLLNGVRGGLELEEFVGEKLKERVGYYGRADFTVSTDGKSVAEVVAEVMELVGSESMA